MHEHEAIARLQRGDIAGLDELVRRHQYQAVRAATLITRDRATAEDVVQSAFLRIVTSIQQFDASRPFGPWFMRIVVNDTLKEMQRRSRQTTLDAQDADGRAALDALPSDEIGPEQLLAQGETREAVAHALGQLTPLQRAAVVQRYYLGMSEAEMAQLGGTSHGAVKLRLFGARERLRKLLGPLWNESAHSNEERLI